MTGHKLQLKAVHLRKKTLEVILFIAFVFLAASCEKSWLELTKENAQSLSSFMESLDGYRIVIVGEEHGRPEPRETTMDLLKADSKRPFNYLALEWPFTDQPVMDRYLNGDDSALDELKRKYDPAHFHGVSTNIWLLFESVRRFNREFTNRPIALRFIDVKFPVEDVAEEARDQHMFDEVDRILKSANTNRVLVCVGAAHAAKSGMVKYLNRHDEKVMMKPLGLLLDEHYHGETVSMKVLAPVDPMWRTFDQEKIFDSPTAIRFTLQWPESKKVISLAWWHPDSGKDEKTAKIFDCAIWR